MTKIIKVECCYDCKYYSNGGKEHHLVCNEVEYKGKEYRNLLNSLLNNIPKWCPLEDLKEKI